MFLPTDKRGVSSLLFIIMTMSAFIMFIATLQLYNVMTDAPKKVVIRHQFDDIGNILANDVVGIVLSLPHGGNIEYTEILPVDVAGQGYWVELNSSKESVNVSTFGYTARYIIGGIRYEINMSSSINATSSGGKITIRANRLI